MPSSIGHALAATAAGWAVARPPRDAHARVVQTTIFAGVGAAADLDLLTGQHHMATHSLGAALIVATVAAVARWPVADRRWRIWFAILCAYATHPLLDALAEDSSPPLGIMAFWPVSSRYYLLPLTIFSSIYRNWHEAGFLVHNLAAIAREVAILAPITIVVGWLRLPRTERSPSPSSGRAGPRGPYP